MRVGMDPRVASSDHGDGGHAQCSPLPLFPFCAVAVLRPSALARDGKGPGVKPGPGLHKRARRVPGPPFLVIFLPGLVYRSVISVVGCVMEMISNPLAASSSVRAFSSVTDRVSRSRE